MTLLFIQGCSGMLWFEGIVHIVFIYEFVYPQVHCYIKIARQYHKMYEAVLKGCYLSVDETTAVLTSI